MIVARGLNNEIGKNNQLLWHLPNDLKHFKEKTSGHYIIMGRKNFEAIGRPLPKRTSVVITRDKSYTAPGCIVVHSPEEAIEAAKGQEEVFVIGGGEIYNQMLDKTSKIYMTIVHNTFDADTFFPPLNISEWKQISWHDFEADEKHPYRYSIVELVRNS